MLAIFRSGIIIYTFRLSNKMFWYSSILKHDMTSGNGQSYNDVIYIRGSVALLVNSGYLENNAIKECCYHSHRLHHWWILKNILQLNYLQINFIILQYNHVARPKQHLLRRVNATFAEQHYDTMATIISYEIMVNDDP